MSVAQIVAPFVAGLMIDHNMLTTWAMIGVITSVIGLAVKSSQSRGTPSSYSSADQLA
jgi:drug/metabolite transporter superfamily protein YnfA